MNLRSNTTAINFNKDHISAPEDVLEESSRAESELEERINDELDKQSQEAQLKSILSDS